MSFKYIPIEQTESGLNSEYRQVKVVIGERPATYYVSWRDSEKVLSGPKISVPEIAYREIRRIPRFRPIQISVVPVKNLKTLTDIAETIEAQEQLRRKER